MVDSIEERKKAFENKFVHDEEMKFKLKARRRKLVGLWASELMGRSETESLEYAMEIVNYGLENDSIQAVSEKIVKDFKEAGVVKDTSDVNQKIQEFEILAMKQITETA